MLCVSLNWKILAETKKEKGDCNLWFGVYVTRYVFYANYTALTYPFPALLIPRALSMTCHSQIPVFDWLWVKVHKMAARKSWEGEDSEYVQHDADRIGLRGIKWKIMNHTSQRTTSPRISDIK